MTEQDQTHVTDADQPWTFKDDLVMVADRTHAGKNRWAPPSHGVFWMQLHNIPPLSMTRAVALAIGGLVGTVLKVDKSVSKECIGRFLRVKVRLNVKEQLMQGTHVQFPDEGMIWVDFKYECLPSYCLICGFLGHPTRSCRESLGGLGTKEGGEKIEDDMYAFRNLDASTDLRGYPLRSGIHKGSGSGESRGGRSSRRQQQSGKIESTKTGSVGKVSSTRGNMGSDRHYASISEVGGRGTVERENNGK